MQTLKLGSKGPDVVRLQTMLAALNLAITVDGEFGPQTLDAVLSFQRGYGLTADGVVDPATWAALTNVIPAELPAMTLGGLVVPSDRVWPLRALVDGRKPIVTSRHAMHNASRSTHYGCDLFYRYDPAVDPPMKIGDGGRTKNFWIPENTFAVAQAGGVVEIAGNSRTGYRLWIRHEGGLATGGFHFTHLAVKRGDAVGLGDDLAIVGDNPADTDPDHLHTELYPGSLGDYPRRTLDPELFWVGARVLPARLV